MEYLLSNTGMIASHRQEVQDGWHGDGSTQTHQREIAALLDAPTILALCREVGYPWRTRLLDPVTTVHRFLLPILHGNTACSHLPHLAAQRVTASACCQARTRLPLGVWQPWLRRTAAVCEHTTHAEGRWLGHRTFLVDGSSVSIPDTPELLESFGQPSGQRPGWGFPVAHLLALFHAGTGFLLEVFSAPWHTHDMAQVAWLHPTLRPGDVLVGVLKELTVFALVYNLVRVVMLAAAKRQSVALERISFIDALRWLSTARPGEPLPPLVVNPDRPDRVEPRAVTRRPKPYPLLTKPRREARNALKQQRVGA